MARIPYDDRGAAAFEADRHIAEQGLVAWREAVAQYLDPHPGMRLLDLGAARVCGHRPSPPGSRAWR
jgi:hypothetical protein